MKHTFNSKEKLILIEASIKGPDLIHQGLFILDTGATHSVITEDFMTVIGYTKFDLLDGKLSVTTATGDTVAKVLKLESLKTLGLLRSNYLITVQKLPYKLFIDGIIGLDFFKNKELLINFKEGFISLS